MTAKAPSLKGFRKWDVLVTIDATMSVVVRGVQAESPEEAGNNALQDRETLRQQCWDLDDANFDSWIHNAYLPDPDDGITPHEQGHSQSQAVLSLFKAASKAYSETTSEEVDLQKYSGSDGLATFLASEFKDVLNGEPDESVKERLLGALQIAIDDLNVVYAAVADA